MRRVPFAMLAELVLLTMQFSLTVAQTPTIPQTAAIAQSGISEWW